MRVDSVFRTFRMIPVAALATLWSCSGSPGSVADALSRGDRFLKEQKYAEAALEYQNALKADSKRGDVRVKLADAYFASGDASRAYREYVRAADLMPNDAAVQLKVGTFLLLAEQYPEAQARATRALQIDSKNVQAQVLLGNSLAGQKDFDGALRELERAIQAQPTMSGYASLGRIQLSQSRQAEAEAAYQRAVSTAPKSPLPRLALASFYWVTAREAEAERTYREAVALDPKDPLANRAMAAFLTGSGRFEEAEPFIRVLADQEISDDGSQRLMLIDYYIAGNRLKDAAAVLANVGPTLQRTPAVQLRSAFLSYSKGDTAQAHRIVDELLTKNSRDAEALVVKARFVASEGKLPDAIRHAVRATEANPRSERAWFLLGVLRSDAEETSQAISDFNEVLKLNPRASDAQLRLAELYLSAGRTEDALLNARSAAAGRPGDAAAQLTLARALIRVGRPDEAEPIAARLRTQKLRTPGIHLVSASLAAGQRQWAVAEREFQEALRLDARSDEGYAGLLGVYLSTGRTSELHRLIDSQVKAKPSANTLVIGARALLNVQDEVGATKLLEETITRYPQAPAPYELLGKLFVSKGKLDEARTHFSTLAKQNSESPGPLTLLGMVEQLRGEDAAARPHYEAALRLDPESAIAANNLALILAESGEQMERATDLAQTAVRGMPDDANAADTLGWVFFKRNSPALALGPLERAAKASPDNPIFHYHLGMVHAGLRNRELARASLSKALSLSTSFDGATDAKRTLDGLGRY